MQNQQSRSNNTQGSAKPKFVAKGHDAILQRFQTDKEPIILTLLTGRSVTGIIVGRDRYAVTLQDKASGAKMTFYKHAIESFGEFNEDDVPSLNS